MRIDPIENTRGDAAGTGDGAAATHGTDAAATDAVATDAVDSAEGMEDILMTVEADTDQGFGGGDREETVLYAAHGRHSTCNPCSMHCPVCKCSVLLAGFVQHRQQCAKKAQMRAQALLSREWEVDMSEKQTADRVHEVRAKALRDRHLKKQALADADRCHYARVDKQRRAWASAQEEGAPMELPNSINSPIRRRVVGDSRGKQQQIGGRQGGGHQGNAWGTSSMSSIRITKQEYLRMSHSAPVLELDAGRKVVNGPRRVRRVRRKRKEADGKHVQHVPEEKEWPVSSRQQQEHEDWGVHQHEEDGDAQDGDVGRQGGDDRSCDGNVDEAPVLQRMP
jgi:hypothetical protein